MLLSIIIPIYNGEKTLPDLIEPILNVTRNDIEFILVDDGSKDNSYALIKKYSEKDSRVIPIHIENSGVSTARNTGLKNAKGKYIYFCDCDDRVFPDVLEKVLPILESNNYDLVTANYVFLFSESNITKLSSMKLEANKALDKTKILKQIISPLVLNTSTDMASLWNKFFRLNLIKEHSLNFNPKVHKGEDWQFILNFLSFSNSAYYFPETLYEYRLDGSQTESKYKKEPGIHTLSSIKLKLQFSEKFDIPVSNDRFLVWYAAIFKELVFSANSDICSNEWKQMLKDNCVKLAAKKLYKLKSEDYLRLEISRKYKLYSLILLSGAEGLLRKIIIATNK